MYDMVGELRAFSFSQDTGAWLRCDGRELRVRDFRPLHYIIGNRFGGDAAAGTFRLPDLAGAVLTGEGGTGGPAALSLAATGSPQTQSLISVEYFICVEGWAATRE